MSDPQPSQLPVGTLWLLELDRYEPDSVPPPLGTSATYQRVEPDGPGALAEAMRLHADKIRERFDGGRRCYVAILDGALATYGWVSLTEEWITELGLHIRLSPGDAYIFDCATLPAYRGRGLYPALLAYIVADLKAEGLRRVWIGADTDSVASQKGIIRAGFSPIADFFPTPAGSRERFYVRGRPGAPAEPVRDARNALLSPST